MFQRQKNVFRVATAYHPVMAQLGLSVERIWNDPRIVVWRKLRDRENCTLDAELSDGQPIRLHIKRYAQDTGFTLPADIEVMGYRAMEYEKIPTAELVGWGKMGDRRSFTIFADLAGYAPADKHVRGGLPFERLLEPTADLAGLLHQRGLHHRDLYLCHFMVPEGADARGHGALDIRLIDAARVGRLPGILMRRRWIVKDLAQFWFSTTQLPITDAQRTRWLARYAEARGLPPAAVDSLRRLIERKAARIARHDARLNAKQPGRNVSIPAGTA